MAYTRSADGIARKGKTEGKNYGDSGPTAKEITGGKKTKGVTGEAMRSMGRNLARAMNQNCG